MNKTKISLLLSLLICFSMLLSLTACGKTPIEKLSFEEEFVYKQIINANWLVPQSVRVTDVKKGDFIETANSHYLNIYGERLILGNPIINEVSNAFFIEVIANNSLGGTISSIYVSSFSSSFLGIGFKKFEKNAGEPPDEPGSEFVIERNVTKMEDIVNFDISKVNNALKYHYDELGMN
ncbi:hypothetical protein FACS1894219_11870 [Clostridia bacterium]|nr:hypothetical protein FACS1894219_11870 [Clostridia bacterium]